jgi:hypothetical protein
MVKITTKDSLHHTFQDATKYAIESEPACPQITVLNVYKGAALLATFALESFQSATIVPGAGMPGIGVDLPGSGHDSWKNDARLADYGYGQQKEA